MGEQFVFEAGSTTTNRDTLGINLSIPASGATLETPLQSTQSLSLVIGAGWLVGWLAGWLAGFGVCLSRELSDARGREMGRNQTAASGTLFELKL